MNPHINSILISAIIPTAIVCTCIGVISGFFIGKEFGKAEELAKWRQFVLPLGMSLVKRYDTMTGEAKMILIKSDGQATVLEIKP